MKGLIIIPKFYEKLWTPEFNNTRGTRAPLWYEIQNSFGFEIRFADVVDVSRDVEVVLMFGVPYHGRPKLIPGLLDLNKNTKLIMWSGDLQCYGRKECLDNKIKVFNRCDIIISQTNEYFVKMYPQYLSKHEVMWHCFSPYKRYAELSFNESPKNKCLLSGSIRNDAYPLRSFIVNKHSAYIDYCPPKYTGDDYAKLLHSYFCCVTSSSIFNYVLAKHLEIPAVGSLLLANETKDLKMAGLIAYQHYIPITKNNVFTKIEQCIKNPNDYNNIRKAGMEFVRKNHSVNNRIEQLKKILYKIS